MIRRIRSIPRLVTEAAPEVADALRAQLAQQVASGRAPDGSAWKPTKDGKKPLAGAAKALAVRAVGTVVLATLGGHEVFHHYGTKLVPKRQILPFGSLPAELGAAIKAGLVRRFRRQMGGC
ncbi:MAG: hypothetical protein IT372_29910 [Polyangiaceae bacterium]|nr:hypothetical protein [Polyangiaceae bacterium]